MSARSRAALLVQAVAAGARWLYPAAFRTMHRTDFPDAAMHLFARESERHTPIRAALSTARTLVTDTLSASPRLWMDTLRGGDERASIPSLLVRKIGRGFQDFGRDLKLAARTAARRPALSLLIMATLGVGIGASSAAFDALDRAIVRPLPFAGSSELKLVVMREVKQDYMTSVPIDAYKTWREQAQTVSGVEVFRRMTSVRVTSSGAEALEAIGMSGGLPALLSVRAVIGRTITAADALPAAPPVAMITEQYWRTAFGGDRSVVGRVLTLSNKPTEIIGVWPSGARLDFFETPSIIRVLPAGTEYPRGSWVQILARVKPGRTTHDVESELRMLAPKRADSQLTYAPRLASPAELLLGPQFVTGVWVVFIGALLLLIAAAANAGHLVLERAMMRHHELGIRMALGGSRSRLLRLFLAEGIAYALGGLAIGAGLAVLLERAIVEYEPRLFIESAGAGIAGRAFVFAAGMATLTAITAAMAPMLRGSRSDISAALGRAGERMSSRPAFATTVLVAIQAALAVSLIFGAALMANSLRALLRVDPGITMSQLAEVSVSLPAARYPTPEARRAFFDRATPLLAGLPGVQGVVTSSMPLLIAPLVSGRPYLEGEPPPVVPPDANTSVANVPTNYLDVMGISLLKGRMFTAGENNVVLVSDAFARSRGGDVIGKHLFLPHAGAADRSLTIIGVVNDVRYSSLTNDFNGQPALYLPGEEAPDAFRRFFIRTSGNTAGVIDDARRRLAEIDPTVPVLAPQTGTEVMREQTAQHRFVALLTGGLAGIGFLLAAAGVYGAVALGVVQRTREIGVRVALGASPRRLVAAFVSSGVRPVIVGAVIGLVGAWLGAPSLGPLLFRVTPHDPATAIFGLCFVIAISAAAAWLPSRRIMRVDPAKTLRQL